MRKSASKQIFAKINDLLCTDCLSIQNYLKIYFKLKLLRTWPLCEERERCARTYMKRDIYLLDTNT